MNQLKNTQSLPPREAWIEIWLTVDDIRKRESLPPREAWIEIVMSNGHTSPSEESLPPREAWIEIAPKLRRCH